jgi:molybdenum cofactor biosynthesis enzyme MoaA
VSMMATLPQLGDRHVTSKGEPRGYIQTARLRELWFHTGTACNLSCPFCLEGSKPGDRRLGLVTLSDVEPFIQEGLALGVEQFSFTGGEPFLVKQLPAILARASAYRPCLVLTNGTEPLLRRVRQLEPLTRSPHPIAFRVSLDYPDPARHDAGRGAGAFERSLQGMQVLHAFGFRLSVARQMAPDEDHAATESAFREIFRAHALPHDLHITSFPEFHPPGAHVSTPEITEHCMRTYHTAETRAGFMCANSRMVIKKNGRMRVYACTLVDDDPSYDLGATLHESMIRRVILKHHRCFSCFRYGATCSELSPAAAVTEHRRVVGAAN